MKVDQTDLKSGINAVIRACAVRSSLPILGNILFAEDSGMLKLAATNNEISISVWIEADIQPGECITLPQDKISKLVSKLDGVGIITIDIDSVNLKTKVRFGKSRMTLPGMKCDDFPLLPMYEVLLFESKPSVFRQSLKRAIVGAAKDESRPVLSGVNFVADNGKLLLQSADQFRASIIEEEIDFGGNPASIIVPVKALRELDRLLPSCESINIGMSSNAIVFELQGQYRIVITSQLIDGNFPSVVAFFDKYEFARTITVNKAELEKAIEIAHIVSSDTDGYFTKLYYRQGESVDEDYVNIQALSNTGAENDGNIGVVTGYSEDIDFFFSSLYLSEALRLVSTEDVTLCFNQQLEPMAIECDNWKHIIMAMQPR